MAGTWITVIVVLMSQTSHSSAFTLTTHSPDVPITHLDFVTTPFKDCWMEKTPNTKSYGGYIQRDIIFDYDCKHYCLYDSQCRMAYFDQDLNECYHYNRDLEGIGDYCCDLYTKFCMDEPMTIGGEPTTTPFAGDESSTTSSPVAETCAPKPTMFCDWWGDPHYKSFTRRQFENMVGGDYWAVRRTEGYVIEVQVRQYRLPMPNYIARTCAVVVRENNDIFAFDMCVHNEHNHMYQAGEGLTAMRISPRDWPISPGTFLLSDGTGKNYVLFLQSGSYVQIIAQYDWVCVFVHTANENAGKLEGLCGTGQTAPCDLLGKDGTCWDNSVDGRGESWDFFDNWNEELDDQGEPREFINSWKIPKYSENNYFERQPSFIDDAIVPCVCETSFHGPPNCNNAARASSFPSFTQVSIEGLPLRGYSGIRKRRSVDPDDANVVSSYTFESGSNLPPPNLTWPTPSGITEAVARAACEAAVSGSAVYITCESEVDSSEQSTLVSACILEVMEGDSLMKSAGATGIFETTCTIEVARKAQNDSSYSAVLQNLHTLVCPAGCYGNGECIDGQCHCFPGWSSADCSFDMSRSTTSVPDEQQILILLDVSESLKDFLSEISGFLVTFYGNTAADTFFQDHKRKVTVAAFDDGLISGEQWELDYSQYASASDLRTAETAEVAAIAATIIAKEATGLTNIGQTLHDALNTYRLDSNWRVILVSDFINIREDPSLASQLQLYNAGSVQIFPVLVDKPIRHEDTYNEVKSSSSGYGIDLITGFSESNIQAIYSM